MGKMHIFVSALSLHSDIIDGRSPGNMYHTGSVTDDIAADHDIKYRVNRQNKVHSEESSDAQF